MAYPRRGGARGSAALRITWRERGGKRPKNPGKKGFGSELIEREVKTALGGTIVTAFEPTGLEAVISIPIDRNLISIRS